MFFINVITLFGKIYCKAMIIIFRNKNIYYLCGLIIRDLRQVEPPSPILTDQKITADQQSDDPLSHTVYMIMGDASGEHPEGFSVCAWSAHTGLSYIGTSNTIIS